MQTNYIVDTCMNKFCSNHGHCENGNCICDFGFYGEDCEYKKCLKKCIHGRCIVSIYNYIYVFYKFYLYLIYRTINAYAI